MDLFTIKGYTEQKNERRMIPMKFEKAMANVVLFQNEDVVTTSCTNHTPTKTWQWNDSTKNGHRKDKYVGNTNYGSYVDVPCPNCGEN